MAQILQTQAQCPVCQQPRLFTKSGPTHPIHALASLFLCGLWIPVWVLVGLSSASEPYRCVSCGSRTGGFSKLAAYIAAIAFGILFITGIALIADSAKGVKESRAVQVKTAQMPASPTETKKVPEPLNISTGPETPDDAASENTSHAAEAFYAARDEIRREFKLGDEVEFSTPHSDGDTGYTPWGYHQYFTWGYVVGRNEYGAKVRNDWDAYIRLNTSTNFEPLFLRLGSRQVGIRPNVAPKPLSGDELDALKDAEIKKKQMGASATLSYYLGLAEKGDAFAQYRLGEILWREQKNKDEAVKWLRKSAAQERKEARKLLDEILSR